MKLTLVCPHCSAELELDDIAPGTRFECPGCGGECIAPGADPPAPTPRPRQLRIPARRDTAPPPVNVTVQQQRQPVLLAAIRGCLILLSMAVILALVVTGCNLLGLFGAAHVAKQTAEVLAATMPGVPAAKNLATAPGVKPAEHRSAGTSADVPAWTAEVRTDPMTDGRTIRATLRENNPPGSIFERPATLALELDERDGIRFGVFGVEAFSIGRFEADVRWDDAPAETLPWSWSGGVGTCLRDGRELFDKLRASRRLRLRVPIPGRNRDAEFSLGGLVAALERADPGRAIRNAAEQANRAAFGWQTKRETDGTVAVCKRARDAWAGVGEISPAVLIVMLRSDGSVGVVGIQTGSTVIGNGRWDTKIGAFPARAEPWNASASGGSAVYGGDAVDLVRRLERARTLRVDVHAGFEHAEVEWRLDGLSAALAAARRGVADL